ncbi:MAG TPA: M28 family peptidase [Kofleriaceae bacterium]
MKLVVLLWLLVPALAHAECRDADPFDKATLHDRLAKLASPELDGRAPGTDGDTAARAIVIERFACAGLVPAGDGGTFEQAFTAQNGKHTANVIGIAPGSDADGDVVIVTAHHDHLGDGHLGANDDGSGVVALLAIAQAITAAPQAKRTVVFAAFGDEEDGMIGSTFFAAHMPKTIPLARVVEVVELDMIGSHDSAGLVGAMGTFAKFPARVLLDKLTPKFKHVHVVPGGRARGSDFIPFCDAGVPYTFFWTPDHRCYHETCDTIDRVDMPHLVDIAKLANELVTALATTDIDLAKARADRGCGQGKASGAR